VNAGSIEGLFFDPGASSLRYDFTLSGFDLSQYQVLDLQFNPSVYLSLSDAMVAPNFQVVILQPGNPPGTPGDYLLEAMTPGALTPASVGIDFTLAGQEQPGPLPYFVYQFNNQNQFVSVVSSGTTSVGTDPSAIPEPSSFWLAVLGLFVTGILGRRWGAGTRTSIRVPHPIFPVERRS